MFGVVQRPRTPAIVALGRQSRRLANALCPSSDLRSRASYFKRFGLVGVTGDQRSAMRENLRMEIALDEARSDFGSWSVPFTILSNKTPQPTPTSVMPAANPRRIE